MRVLILTHHYPPEVGAPQTRLAGTAAFLKRRGHDVLVLTALPSYPTGVVPPAYRGRAIVREAVDGVRTLRTWTYARPGGSARLRLLNQLSFATTAVLALPRLGRPDAILVESPPLFLGATGALLGRLLGAATVLQVSDLWPDVAIELGALRDGRAIRAARAFERWVYRSSDRVIVVTESWAARLRERDVPPGRIAVVTNGVDVDFLDPRAAREEGRRARAELGLDGMVVAACVGTMSHVYDYELILQAARRLTPRAEVRFLLVGGGSQSDAIQRRIAELGLTNVVMLPPQPRARVRSLLAAADLAVVALRPLPFTDGQLPVRILEAMAMELPVVLAATGEARRVVGSAEAGLVVHPEAADAFARAVERLALGEESRRGMGSRGRQAVLERFSRASVAGHIERALEAAAGRGRPT
jgi:colanic acid biosynthesis glycosyl transferase WcaI